MKFLIKGFVFRLIYTLASFLVSLFIAKFAGADRFGVLSLMIINAAFIQIITGLGTDAAIVWHGISEKMGDRNSIFSITFYSTILQLLLFVVSAFLIYGFAGRTILTGETHTNLFYAELLYFIGLVVAEKYTSLFYSQQMAALCNRLLAIVSAALFLTILIVLFFSPVIIANNPEWIFSLFVFIPAMVLVIFYHFKFTPLLKKVNRDVVKSFTNFSFIVLITNIIQFVAYRVDFWLIDYFHGRGDVGIYAQATKFSQLLWIIPVVLAGLVVPALKNKINKLSVTELISACRLLFFTHIILGVGLLGAAWILYKFFLPDIYFTGFRSLVIMLPGYLFFIITTILAAYFSANGLLKINLLGSSLCLVLILTLDLILIPKFSFTGAAIANLFTYVLTSIYFIMGMTKQTGVAFKDFFMISKSDLKIFSTRFANRNDNIE